MTHPTEAEARDFATTYAAAFQSALGRPMTPPQAEWLWRTLAARRPPPSPRTRHAMSPPPGTHDWQPVTARDGTHGFQCSRCRLATGHLPLQHKELEACPPPPPIPTLSEVLNGR